MVWLVIIGIFIVAFGPLFWFMPSPRERRLARLRQQAYRQGMRVELRRLPRPDVAAEDRVSAGGRPRDTTGEYAAYLMPVPRRLRHLPALRVLRHGDGAAAAEGWAFEAGKRPDHPLLGVTLAALAPLLGELGDDVLAVECEPLAVAGYFLEGPGTTPERVDELAASLGRAARALADLDARQEAGNEPGKI